jgi:hypothetical protein
MRGEDISSEDIWEVALGWQARISGPSEDIEEVVLGRQARISGPSEDI